MPAKRSSNEAPWRRGNPRKKTATSRKLTNPQKAEARARASKAGRKYPNLVDNMAVAKKARVEKKAKKSAKKKAKKKAAKKKARQSAAKKR
jgi:hypothetical protein